MVFEQVQITNLKLTSAELSPECLRWFEIDNLNLWTNRGGAPRELSVQSSGQQLSGNSATEGKGGNDRSKDEIELYRQIYAQSWCEAVWDSVPAYRIAFERLLKVDLETMISKSMYVFSTVLLCLCGTAPLSSDKQLQLESDEYSFWIPRYLKRVSYSS